MRRRYNYRRRALRRGRDIKTHPFPSGFASSVASSYYDFALFSFLPFLPFFPIESHRILDGTGTEPNSIPLLSVWFSKFHRFLSQWSPDDFSRQRFEIDSFCAIFFRVSTSKCTVLSNSDTDSRYIRLTIEHSWSNCVQKLNIVFFFQKIYKSSCSLEEKKRERAILLAMRFLRGVKGSSRRARWNRALPWLSICTCCPAISNATHVFWWWRHAWREQNIKPHEGPTKRSQVYLRVRSGSRRAVR